MTTRSEVGHRTARAALWAFLSTAGAKVITLISLALLARLLAPNEFGLLAFALVYITYVETIGDLGSGMALVYWPDRREEASQITFFVNVVAGIAWCALTLFLAPFVADFFNAPNGTPIVRALAFSFIIKYLGNTHDALAQKDLRFRARVIPEVGLAAVKAAIALLLAAKGFGAWSLVWGQLAGLTAWTVALWVVVPWRPSLRLPLDLLKPMLGYGRGIITINVIAAIVNNADLLVVGRYLGTTQLGLYQMAEKIPEASIVVVIWVISKVLFPAFAKLHAAGEELRGPYLSATRYVSTLSVPAAAGLSVLAYPIVRLFFGPKWMGAAPILSIFAIYAGLRSLSTHAGDLLKATGRANTLALLSVMKAAMLVPALFVGVRPGVVGVITAVTVVAAISTVVTLIVAARVLHTSLFTIGRSFAPSLAAGAIMTVALLGWLRAVSGAPAAVVVFGGVAAGAAVYAIALWLFDREIFASIVQRFFRRTSDLDDPRPAG